MKRRKFLQGAVGVVVGGASGLQASFAADPCPPQIAGASANRLCGMGSMNLADAAAQLAPGQSVQFTKNTLQRAEDIQWQVQTIWYDSTRGELQYMGKPASSQSTDYSHYIYDESSDSWSTTGQSLFPGTGHVWDATFDSVNGDYWFHRYNDNTLQWFDRSDGANGRWKETRAQTSPALKSGNPTFAAMGWHPNLFGAGNPGIFIWAVFRFFAYNPVTQQFSVLSPKNFSGSGIHWNRSTGQALYLPATDQLICFAKDAGNGHPAILVDAGAGNSSDAVASGLVSTAATPPIEIYGGGGSSNQGHVVSHPRDQNRLLVLEEHGSSRVWQSSDFGSSWQLESYSHPFQSMVNWSAGEYTVGTIAPHGVIVGMTSDTDGGEMVLWKPA